MTLRPRMLWEWGYLFRMVTRSIYIRKNLPATSSRRWPTSTTVCLTNHLMSSWCSLRHPWNSRNTRKHLSEACPISMASSHRRHSIKSTSSNCLFASWWETATSLRTTLSLKSFLNEGFSPIFSYIMNKWHVFTINYPMNNCYFPLTILNLLA